MSGVKTTMLTMNVELDINQLGQNMWKIKYMYLFVCVWLKNTVFWDAFLAVSITDASGTLYRVAIDVSENISFPS
jgi:hypothetical protein